jgi:hypothetical protein
MKRIVATFCLLFSIDAVVRAVEARLRARPLQIVRKGNDLDDRRP